MLEKKKSSKLWLVIALLVFADGFFFATLYDLPITQALYAPQNGFAIFMEAVGWYPMFLPALFAFALLAARKNMPVWLRIAGGALYAGAFSVVFYNTFEYFCDRGALAPVLNTGTILFILAAVVFAGLLLWAAFALPQKLRPRLEFFSAWGTVFLVADEALINLLKYIWQRTRFDDMMAAGSFADFTPWYTPFGNGGSSFPSGHTAKAVAILLLIVLCDVLAAKKWQRNLAYAVSWLYIAAMAYSRLVMGRHFLSDTLAGAGLIALLLFIMRRIPFYKKQLALLPDVTFPWTLLKFFGAPAKPTAAPTPPAAEPASAEPSAQVPPAPDATTPPPSENA